MHRFAIGKLSLRHNNNNNNNKGLKQSYNKQIGHITEIPMLSKEIKNAIVWISCPQQHLPADLLLAAYSPCIFPTRMTVQSADDKPCRPLHRGQHQWGFWGSQEWPRSLLVCLLILRAASRAQFSAERSARCSLRSLIVDSWLATRLGHFKCALLWNNIKYLGLAKCNGRIFRESNFCFCIDRN